MHGQPNIKIKSKVLVKCAAPTFMAEEQAKHIYVHTYMGGGTKQLGTAAVGGTTGTDA